MEAMKSMIGGFAAQLVTAGTCVATMKNFNPFTPAFWATIVGILIMAVVAGFIGEAVQKDLDKLLKKWHSGTRKPPLKPSSD